MNGNAAGVPIGTQIAWGTVGWVDRAEWYDQGDGSNGQTGKTLVYVTLFAGRTPDTTPDQTQAQGQPLMCQIGGGLFRIPPKGTQVLVAIPSPHGLIPGASVIIATSEPSPAIQFSKDRVVMDYGDQTVVIRAACVVIESTASPNPQYLAVGQPPSGGAAGILMMDETGSGIAVQSGVVGLMASDGGSPPSNTAFMQIKNGEIALAVGGGTSGAKWEGGNATIFGANGYFYTAGVYLGATAVAAKTCLYGTSGSPVPSTSVFVGT